MCALTYRNSIVIAQGASTKMKITNNVKPFVLPSGEQSASFIYLTVQKNEGLLLYSKPQKPRTDLPFD